MWLVESEVDTSGRTEQRFESVTDSLFVFFQEVKLPMTDLHIDISLQNDYKLVATSADWPFPSKMMRKWMFPSKKMTTLLKKPAYTDYSRYVLKHGSWFKLVLSWSLAGHELVLAGHMLVLSS